MSEWSTRRGARWRERPARIDRLLPLVLICVLAACTEPPRSSSHTQREAYPVDVELAPSEAEEATGIHLVTILNDRLTPGSNPVMMRHIDFEVIQSFKGPTPATRSLSFWVDTDKCWDPAEDGDALLVIRDAPTEHSGVTLYPSTPENIEVASAASP